MNKFRSLFPFLKHNKNTIYLDTAASGLKMQDGINAEVSFLSRFGTNIDRSLYDQGMQSTTLYEQARKITADFLNCRSDEVIFTSGTTDGLNLLSNMICPLLPEGSEIIVSQMEHNSNYLPWLNYALTNKIKLIELPLDLNTGINITDLKKSINSKTKLLSISMASNVLGITPPLKEIIQICHEHNILVVGDGAQYVPHHKIDTKDLDIDFFVFSGHKLYASNGIGVLYGKYNELLKLTPARVGGGVLSYFENNLPVYKNPPYMFEAGTPNIAGAISLGAVIKRLSNISIDYIYEQEMKFTTYLVSKLSLISDIEIISKNSQTPLVSFIHQHIHGHDLAGYFASKQICIRAGFHCAERLLRQLGYHSGCLRVSIAFYNTIAEIDKFLDVLKEAILFFKGETK